MSKSKKLFCYDGCEIACLDDLRDEPNDKRTWIVYEDSWGDKVHHIANGMTKEDAEWLCSMWKERKNE